MDTLNLGILAHVDAGKTSLTERLLYAAGVVDHVGRVDDGDTQTDTLALERRRGITIKSAVVSFEVDGTVVNLIDTPGHPDFIAEVERVLDVLDGVVLVVSAVEGVQPQTRVLMRTLRRLGLPVLIFINKIDRSGARSEALLGEITAKLAIAVVPMGSVRDLGTKNAAFVPYPATAAEVVEPLADHDDLLLTTYLADRPMTAARVRRELAEQTQAGQAHPVFFGSAITGAGVPELTAGIVALLPTAGGDVDAVPSGSVFKIERGPDGQKVALIRMFNGSLRIRDRMRFGRAEDRVTRISVVERGAGTSAEAVTAGRIARVWGLAHARIGDPIGRRRGAPTAVFAPPTLETVVIPARPAEAARLRQALTELAEQDPLIDVRTAGAETAVSLYGEVQKEVIEATLAEDYGLLVAFQETTTIYIERVVGTGEAVTTKDAEDNPFLAGVGLRIEPSQPASGIAYARDGFVLGTMPPAFFTAVEDTVHATLAQGLYGWQVTDCRVTLTHTGYFPRQSHAHAQFDKSMSSTGADFRQLTPLVVMTALRKAGTRVCEPVHRFRLELPAETLAATLAMLAEVQAVPHQTTPQGVSFVLEGEVPAAQVHALTRLLPGVTHGEGLLDTSFDHYRLVAGSPPSRPRTDAIRRFVGRSRELQLFSTWLEASSNRDAAPNGQEPFNVLWVYGPGGIGKSTLLRAFAETARNAGYLLAEIDGGRVMPTPDGIRSAVWESLTAGIDAHVEPADAPPPAKPSVIMLDAAERLQPVEGWLREEFLPALPAETRVIIAGRRPPDTAWRSDPGWRELLCVMALRNLSPAQTRALLEIEGISTDLLDQVMALTHGHPLAVSLLIDAVRRSRPGTEVPETLQDLPDVVTALLNQMVEQAPTVRHRAALQISAHASVTAEPLLRAALPAEPEEASELWEWLRGLTIMEEAQSGIFPHDVARDVLEADLRRRDPDTYADIHRRLRGYLVDQVKAAAGNPDGLQRAVADLLFLIRDHPVAGAYWYWDALEGCPGQPVQPEQFDLIIAMTRDTQGEQQAKLAAHWLRRQPEAFRVFETPDGEIGGYAARLALHLAHPEDIDADPGAAALWRYVQQHHPARPGELVLGWRFVVDRDPDERHPRLAGTMFGAWHVIDILLRGPTAWEFDACYTDLDYWERFFNHFDFVHVPEADYQIGSARYVAFAHDWRRVGVADWLEVTAARELGEQVTVSAPEPAAMLSQEEFAASVKEALRSFHQPQALRRNPLVASSIVQSALREHPDDRPDQVLRGLILDAAHVVKSDPRAEIQYRVLDRTYLRPAPSQEKAAELLDLPFSTYRRYRDRGIEAITDWLWEHDIETTSHG